jgi:hypothetical protein
MEIILEEPLPNTLDRCEMVLGRVYARRDKPEHPYIRSQNPQSRGHKGLVRLKSGNFYEDNIQSQRGVRYILVKCRIVVTCETS